MADIPKFHFSPRSNRAHEIRWREWGSEAFREAREKGKPVLLSLSAVWCHWCHVMDETSYSNESVISYVNEHYVPIRVDNDQRPDVNARYNMGGWPTTALLTPDGETLTGGTYLSPEKMLEMLPKVFVHYTSNKEEVRERVEEIRGRRLAAAAGRRGRVSPDVFDTVLRSVADAYDPVHGGFGEAPKFPHSDAIDLLLYGHRRDGDPDLLHMARKTLEKMWRGGVFDQEWKGFFRYATKRDWSEPHYEKMLEDNANLLRSLLGLYRVTGGREHADAASQVIEYMEWKLRDRDAGFFYGSQDADEEFYELPAGARDGREEPYIDRTCYVSWNAMAMGAYLEASWVLERPDLREAALAALEFVWRECHEPGKGVCRFHAGGGPQVFGLLGDQAHTARALLDAYEVTGEPRYLQRAIELADLLLKRFADREFGGFFDVWDDVDAVGRLGERQKSVQENAVCADVLIRLHHLTRDERYETAARETLEAFVVVAPQLGHFAAGYARQVDTFLHPPAVVSIVGDPGDAATQALHRGALALEAPYRVVQVLHPGRDASRIEALYLAVEPSPAAYACVGTMCSQPVTDPAELANAVRDMREATRQSHQVVTEARDAAPRRD